MFFAAVVFFFPFNYLKYKSIVHTDHYSLHFNFISLFAFYVPHIPALNNRL